MAYPSLGKLFYKAPEQYEQYYQLRYHNEAAVHFDFSIRQAPAFLVMHLELLQLTEEIRRLDKQLDWICRHLPRIAKQQYTTWAIIEEIKLSNEIEGIRSSKDDIRMLVEHRLPMRHEQRFLGFVQQYRMLMNREAIDLSDCQAIRTLYDALCLPDVLADDAQNAPDGLLFRREPVVILSETQKEVHHGLYPEAAIVSAMTKALAILNDEQLSVLLRIPVFHYLFAYIHPFYDGNGRMDRFISSYFLAWNFNPLLGYHLSYSIKKELPVYYRLFKETNDPRNRGDLTPFVLGFLQLILHASQDLHSSLLQRLEQLTGFRELLRQQIAEDQTFRVLHILLMNTLFGYRGLTIHELAQACGLGEEIAIRALRQTEAGHSGLLLRERDGETVLFSLRLEALGKPAAAGFRQPN